VTTSSAFEAPPPLVGNPVFAIEHGRDKHVCMRCRKARAGFVYRRRYQARRDHDLCRRCFRTLRAGLARWAEREFPRTARIAAGVILGTRGDIATISGTTMGSH
jgi:hypothetical protein